MLVAGGAQGRFQRSKAQLIAPTMAVDGGMMRPAARTLHKGDWSDEQRGLVIFGGETDQEMCDPQVYRLKVSVHGWKWEMVESSGDDSMPVPGKPTAKHPHAPWANRGGMEDPGCRVGHCFTRTRNFMVLTGGMRDRGLFQNAVYVFDLYTGEWSKPVVRLTPPRPNDINSSCRTLEGTTPEGLPTPRTGHSTAGFHHGIVLFGGFDGKYLGDVHYLYFLSGVGLVLKEKEDDKNSSVRRLNRYIIAVILEGSSAAENKLIKTGDYVMQIGELEVTEETELTEVNDKLWGPIGSLLSIRFLRYRGRAEPPEDLGKHSFRRGDRLHHKDGVWTWLRPGVCIDELTDENWCHQSGVSGIVSCQPSPRFYHSSASIDNNVLIFGGFDGCDYQNDLYILETYAEGDFQREWKWRAPTTSGPRPSRRSYAGLGIVGRRAVITGGMHGRERFGDIYVLDCDEWSWTNLTLHTMIPISQHCVATYTSHPTAVEYDQITSSELQGMSMEQLYDLIKSKGTAASEHEPKDKTEVLNLVRCLLLRPGILLHSGLQSPKEEGEVKGRRNDTWILELPYLASDQYGSPIESPGSKRSPGAGSPTESSPLGSPINSPMRRGFTRFGKGSPLGKARRKTSDNDHLLTDVLVVGSNVQGYLGLGLENQPTHPEDSDLGPARGAHDTNPTTCIRLECLSTNCFEYSPTAPGAGLGGESCVLRMACGSGHVMALCKDGRVFSWGKNENGQLGLGDNRQRQTPQEVYTFPAGSHELKDIACGPDHSLAVSIRDELFAWGKNGHGQLGLGHASDRNSPQRVDTLCFRNVQHIAGGGQHSLVYVKSGGLYSFGCNDHGQLGSGNQLGSKFPDQVALLQEVEMVSVGAGMMHSAAVSTTGACYTWGGGIRGQLGHGRFQGSFLATEVMSSGLAKKSAFRVMCGNFFTAVMATDPATDLVEAWLFGSNKHGELGFGAGGQDCAVPVFVQHLTGKNLVAIDLGAAHCLATCKDGMVYGWGCNRSGQLGLGHSRDMWAPQQILIEEKGRTAEHNYPWLATCSAETRGLGMRTGNPNTITKAFAGHHASFFVCGRSLTGGNNANQSPIGNNTSTTVTPYKDSNKQLDDQKIEGDADGHAEKTTNAETAGGSIFARPRYLGEGEGRESSKGVDTEAV